MSVLDTWYLLFKTDASQAKNDVAALEKQIESLKDKGHARSEQETADLKEYLKQHKELSKSLKDTTDQQDKLGQSFVKTIENAAQAATSLFAFSVIKAGVQHVTDFNSALRVTAGILGQNSSGLAAFAAAAEHAGGTQEGAVGAYSSLFQYYSSKGLNTSDPQKLLEALRADLSQRGTAAGKALLLQRLGISDTGIISLAESSDQDFRRSIAQGQSVALSPDQQQKLRDLKQTEVDLTQELDHWLGVLGAEIAGPLIGSLKAFSDFLHGISNIPGGSTTLGLAGGTAASLAGGGILGKFLTGGIGAGIGAAARFTGIGLAATGIGTAAWYLLGKEQDAINSAFGKKQSPAGHSAVDFWMSQGYNRAQASAWAAQEQSESSGNPRAFNKGHYGLYQWSEARRQNILAATGIDVATASADKQRQAAAWEANHLGIAAKVKAAGSAGAASDILTRQYEAPYSGATLSIEAAKRAMLASNISFGGTSPGGSKTVNVKTGDIHINTQATDANGIASAIGPAMRNQIRVAVTHWDDGVAY